MRYSLVWARRAPNLVSTAVALFVFGWVPGGFAYNLGDPPPRTTTVGQPTRPTTAISTIEPGIIPHPTSASTAPSPPLTRRDAWIQSQQNIGSVTLAALLAGETTVPSSALALPISNNNNNNKKTIVITGSNSGIGFEACRRLALQGHTLVMACRTQDKAQRAVERLQEATTTTLTTARLIPAECDLASMQSIRSFADHLPILLETGLSRSSSSIDTLCLNAGLARNTAATDCARTLDGFELTGKCDRAYFLEWNIF